MSSTAWIIVWVWLGLGILFLALTVYLIRRIDRILQEEEKWEEGFIKFRDDDIDDEDGIEAGE